MDAVKVDLVIPGLNVGGSERQLVGLAAGLAARGVDVHVVTLKGGGVLEDELRAEGIPIASLGATGSGPTAPLASLALMRRWRTRRPDVVQAWLPQAQVVALPVARLLRVPQRIMVLRSMSAPVRLTRTTRAALAIAARASTLVVGNSRAVVDDNGWPIGKKRRFVIPNAVDLPLTTCDAGVSPARGITVANFTAIKGYPLLMEALSRLATPPPTVLVGSGPEKAGILAHVQQSGLTSVVSIEEGVLDPLPLLLASQFFVLPSSSEGLPNAVMEAMAAGLPIVAFRVGGLPEIVEDGVTGILVEPGDVQGLADAIARVVADPEWRVAAGAAARERMKEFSWDAMIQRNMEVLGMASSP